MQDWLRLGKQAEEDEEYEKAVEYYQKAAAAGDIDGWCLLGILYCDLKDYPKALDALQKAANSEDNTTKGRAAALLGTLYDRGWGVNKDKEQALRWFETALSAGEEDAYWWLGEIFKYDKHDYPKAIEHYEKAAIDGNPCQADAEFELGDLYFDEYDEYDGIEVDYDKAVAWFSKAAEHGNSDAMISLGKCYEFGDGVEVNTEKAQEYYEKALAEGNEDAHWWLGKHFDYCKEYSKAIVHYEKAAVDSNPYQSAAEKELGFHWTS